MDTASKMRDTWYDLFSVLKSKRDFSLRPERSPGRVLSSIKSSISMEVIGGSFPLLYAHHKDTEEERDQDSVISG